MICSPAAVSYTHLDVYKRQLECFAEKVKTTNKIKDIEFIPLVGGLGTNREVNILSNALCEKVAANFPRSTIRYLYAPMIATNILTAQAFLDSKPIKAIFSKAKMLDMAVVGVDGDLDHSSTIENALAADSDAVTREDVAELKRSKAVGCICARFYDLNGNPCSTSLNRRVIAVNTETLKSIPVSYTHLDGRRAGMVFHRYLLRPVHPLRQQMCIRDRHKGGQ